MVWWLNMLYYIHKTGMKMFDLCRVYGLALVLDTLSSIEDIDERIILENCNAYYRIQGPKILLNDPTLLKMINYF